MAYGVTVTTDVISGSYKNSKKGLRPPLGAGGRWFESSRPDHLTTSFFAYTILFHHLIPLTSKDEQKVLGLHYPEQDRQLDIHRSYQRC